ncbi:MAG: putative metal-dependent hydrolase [Thermoanaerobaculia bacterium]|nr:putative metal-dependent hydrolase [Thermoanaerobaculia bacterium]
MSDPRYPIGPFQRRDYLEAGERREMIDLIAAAPQKMRASVRGLDPKQLDTPYRDGGWMLRQVVHHVPDSHLNAYIRLKLALTEHEPAIKPYDEAAWAELPDSKLVPIETSLALLENVHERFVVLLRSMNGSDFARKFTHPDHGLMTLDWLVAMYSWHSRHHVAHITSLRERMKWS